MGDENLHGHLFLRRFCWKERQFFARIIVRLRFYHKRKSQEERGEGRRRWGWRTSSCWQWHRLCHTRRVTGGAGCQAAGGVGGRRASPVWVQGTCSMCHTPPTEAPADSKCLTLLPQFGIPDGRSAARGECFLANFIETGWINGEMIWLRAHKNQRYFGNGGVEDASCIFSPLILDWTYTFSIRLRQFNWK